MKTSLSAFQDAFAAALQSDEPDTSADWLRALAEQPGFAVYRNTAFKGCVDALRANFPTVERLVGADWMTAAAATYARHTPPSCPQLIDYGDGFADFLQRFGPAQALPYLAEVARLDRLWLEVFTAAEQPRLMPRALRAMTPQQLAGLHLQPCVAARWHWSGLPAFTLWRCNRDGAELPEPLIWQGEGTLICRWGGAVRWQALSQGGCAFLDACAQGLRLDAASAVALEAEPALDFNELLVALFAAGVFTGDRHD